MLCVRSEVVFAFGGVLQWSCGELKGCGERCASASYDDGDHDDDG